MRPRQGLCAPHPFPCVRPQAYGRKLMGITLMQDVYLGVIVAMLPLFAEVDTVSAANLTLAFVKMVVCFAVLLAVAVIVTRYLLKALLRPAPNVPALAAGALQPLGAIVLCFAMLKVTEALGISMELGCFVAGLMVKSSLQPGVVLGAGDAREQSAVERAHRAIQHIQTFFSLLFFSSIGMCVARAWRDQRPVYSYVGGT